jgi:hypothetical protein
MRVCVCVDCTPVSLWSGPPPAVLRILDTPLPLILFFPALSTTHLSVFSMLFTQIRWLQGRRQDKRRQRHGGHGRNLDGIFLPVTIDPSGELCGHPRGAPIRDSRKAQYVARGQRNGDGGNLRRSVQPDVGCREDTPRALGDCLLACWRIPGFFACSFPKWGARLMVW